MQKYCLSKDVNVECSKDSSIDINVYKTPNVIDLRDFCLPTNNQGNTPHCVGYTVAAYFEVFNWMNTHYPRQMNAQKIYSFGRNFKCDSPCGTKIEYCLEYLKKNEFFSGNIVTYSNTYDDQFVNIVKGSVHQNGVLMCAFKITDEWYKLSWSDVIKTNENATILGGHCVLCCGYCKKGLYIQNSWGYENWGNYGFGIVPWKIVNEQLNYYVFISNFVLNQNKITELLDGNNQRC